MIVHLLSCFAVCTVIGILRVAVEVQELPRDELKEIANAIKVSQVSQVSQNIGGLKEGWRVDL